MGVVVHDGDAADRAERLQPALQPAKPLNPAIMSARAVPRRRSGGAASALRTLCRPGPAIPPAPAIARRDKARRRSSRRGQSGCRRTSQRRGEAEVSLRQVSPTATRRRRAHRAAGSAVRRGDAAGEFAKALSSDSTNVAVEVILLDASRATCCGRRWRKLSRYSHASTSASSPRPKRPPDDSPEGTRRR